MQHRTPKPNTQHPESVFPKNYPPPPYDILSLSLPLPPIPIPPLFPISPIPPHPPPPSLPTGFCGVCHPPPGPTTIPGPDAETFGRAQFATMVVGGACGLRKVGWEVVVVK